MAEKSSSGFALTFFYIISHSRNLGTKGCEF
jgi:hypothetical protein